MRRHTMTDEWICEPHHLRNPTMALHPTAPIGASMMHLLGETSIHQVPIAGANDDSSSSLPREANLTGTATPQHSTNTPVMPCILLPQETTIDDECSSSISKRILVQGPQQSGRTSMAMNLAYSCAATAIRDVELCHCLLQSCRCTSVVIYRKAHTSSPPARPTGNDEFPVPCRFRGGGSSTTRAPTRNPLAASDQTRKSTQQVSESYQGNSSVDFDDWDPKILRRIRIQYVTSARDVLEDLLGVQAKPLHEHPKRAIIIDGLEDICQVGAEQQQGGGRYMNTGMTMSVMQTCKQWTVGCLDAWMLGANKWKRRLKKQYSLTYFLSIHRFFSGGNSGYLPRFGTSSRVPSLLCGNGIVFDENCSSMDGYFCHVDVVLFDIHTCCSGCIEFAEQWLP